MGPGSLHVYQKMLLLWSGDPGVRTAVLEEDEEAESGARPLISGKERDWRSSLADSCSPEAGLGCQGPCCECMDQLGWRAQTGTSTLRSPRGELSASLTGWDIKSGAEAI